MMALQTLLWIAEHWWIVAILAVVMLCATLWTGIVQAGAVIAALMRLLAAIIRFFATQTAEKILFGFVCVVLALSAGFQHGRSVTNATWERRETARAAAAEKLRAAAERQAQQHVTDAQTAEDADAAAAKQRINDYARTLPNAIDACRITAADLVAAGVPDHRRPKGRDPGRLQQAP